jgi:hypothetical protein
MRQSVGKTKLTIVSKSWAVPEAVKPTTVRQAHRLLNFANQLTFPFHGDSETFHRAGST